VPARGPSFNDCVFLNCPIDSDYWPIFEAIVFSVIDSRFVPRSALEEADSGEVRLHKIFRLIQQCRYAIHDLSRIEFSEDTALPRFNMPFELGLDLGCREYGQRELKRKRCLILEAKPYRYRAFLSDISGQDIRSHNSSPDQAITVVRNWLATTSRRKRVPGPKAIRRRFAGFAAALPTLCEEAQLDRHDVQFVEYVTLAEEWIKTAPE